MATTADVLRLMIGGDTLGGQKELVGADGAADPAWEVNCGLYDAGPVDRSASIEDEQQRLLDLLAQAKGAAQAVVLYNLGCIALRLDDVMEAKQRFTEVLRLDPANRFAKHNLAYANELLAEYDQAKSLYVQVLEQDPGMALSRMNLALLRVQQGDVLRGVEELRAISRAAPHNQGLLLYLCRALLSGGTRDDAAAVLEELEHRRDWQEYLDLRECYAYALFLADHQAEAEQAFRGLVAANPKNLFARLGLIKILAARGNFTALRPELEQYEALNPPQSVKPILSMIG